MKTKNCKTCAKNKNCPYLKNFNMNQDVGCVEWQDQEYINITMTDRLENKKG